jgi:hypothetical protein
MGGKFKRLIWLWMQCFNSMKNVMTFVPFFLYAILQLILLFSLTNFSQGPFSKIFVPIINKLFGEPALHYPNFYLILSPFYSQINIVLSGLIGIIIIGMATYLFAGTFNGEKHGFGQSLKKTLPRYGLLFIIWIIETALTLLMIIGIPLLLKNFFQPDYRLGQIFEMVGLLFAILTASVFAFTTVLIILEKQKLFQAIAKTFVLFKRNAVTTFFLIAVPALLYFPINYLTRKAPVLITKNSPEIIVTILAAGIFVSFISSYFQIGAITRFYLLLNQSRKY